MMTPTKISATLGVVAVIGVAVCAATGDDRYSFVALGALVVAVTFGLIRRARKVDTTPAQRPSFGFWYESYILMAISLALIRGGYDFLFVWPNNRHLREIITGDISLLLGLVGAFYAVFRLVRQYGRAKKEAVDTPPNQGSSLGRDVHG